MELRQLEYLVAVIEEASFTRAAARVHVAQPGVSAQIRQLERELGQPLLDRSTRTVRPTEAGAAVLPHARAALAAVAGIRAAVDDLAGLLRGHVSVGTVAAGGPIDLPGRLADFHQDYPGVEVTLTEDTSERLTGSLLAGRVDLAIIGLGDTDPPGLAVEVITDRPLAAVMSSDHPLARRQAVKLKELADHPIITLPPGSGIRAILDAGFAAIGLRPRVAFEASAPAVVIRLAERGLGIAVLSAAEDYNPEPSRLVEVPIIQPQMRGRLVLAWRADPPPGPATRALARRLTE